MERENIGIISKKWSILILIVCAVLILVIGRELYFTRNIFDDIYYSCKNMWVSLEPLTYTKHAIIGNISDSVNGRDQQERIKETKQVGLTIKSELLPTESSLYIVASCDDSYDDLLGATSDNVLKIVYQSKTSKIILNYDVDKRTLYDKTDYSGGNANELKQERDFLINNVIPSVWRKANSFCRFSPDSIGKVTVIN